MSYSNLTTAELRALWEELRQKALQEGIPKGDSEIYFVRRELERREGWERPRVDYNFEKDVTD